MSKWIECHCFLLDKTLSDCGIDPEESAMLVKFRFKIDIIESYREVMDEGKETVSQKECLVFFKSGESIIIDMSYNELTKLLDEAS